MSKNFGLSSTVENIRNLVQRQIRIHVQGEKLVYHTEKLALASRPSGKNFQAILVTVCKKNVKEFRTSCAESDFLFKETKMKKAQKIAIIVAFYFLKRRQLEAWFL